MTTTPAHNEPSVLADGFLGIAFRRLREGLLPHMRSVLGADFQAEIGSQRNRRTVRLTDAEDVYYLLDVWLRRHNDFLGSFTPGRRDFSPGRNWPTEIMQFRSEKWAHQGSYTDDDVGKILDTIALMLDAVKAGPQAEAAEQLADEFEAYLHSHIGGIRQADMDSGMPLSLAEVAAGQVIAARSDEPDVFAEGFLSKAWRRLGEGLGPYMERITGRKLDNSRDVHEILSGNIDKVDRRINRKCSNLLEARDKWAHQGSYRYRHVRVYLANISEVLRAISENELAQAVDQLRDELNRLHHPTSAVAQPDEHDITDILPMPVADDGASIGVFLTARSAPELSHRAFDILAGTSLVLTSETPIALSPPRAAEAARVADTAEEYYQRGEYQNAVDAASAAIARNPDLAAEYLVRGRAHGRLGNMEAASADFAAANRLDPDIRQSLEQAVNFFNRGVDAFGRGEIDFAIGNFTRAIELNPQYARAYHSRGIAYKHKGEHDLAIDDFTHAIELNPRFAAAYHERGFVHDDKGEYDLAIADCDAALSINPQSFASYHNRGIARYHKGDYDQTIADCDAALSINPQLANAYINRGAARYHKGDYDRAIDDCNAALSINSQLDEAYNNRGNAYCNKGDYDQAIADYNAALRINPHDADAYNNRGNAYGNKGEYDLAIADYNTALNIDSQHVNAYNNRGVAYGNKGEYDLAIADYNAALRINPQRAGIYNNRGNAHANKGDYDQAIADYNTALNIDSQYVNAYNNRGNAHANKGDYDQAVADYNTALNIDSQYVNAYYNRGNAHANKGDYDQAVADYDVALELVTDDGRLQSLRESREQVIRLRDTITEFDQAVADNPADPDVWHLRGLHYRDERDDHDRAISDFTAALRLTPDNPEILYDRGLAHENLGDDDSALSDYGNAVTIKPNYPEAYYALGMIRTRRRQHQEAIADFDQAIAHNPDNALAYQRRGVCYYHLDNKEQAHADFNKAGQLGFNP